MNVRLSRSLPSRKRCLYLRDDSWCLCRRRRQWKKENERRVHTSSMTHMGRRALSSTNILPTSLNLREKTKDVLVNRCNISLFSGRLSEDRWVLSGDQLCELDAFAQCWQMLTSPWEVLLNLKIVLLIIQCDLASSDVTSVNKVSSHGRWQLSRISMHLWQEVSRLFCLIGLKIDSCILYFSPIQNICPSSHARRHCLLSTCSLSLSVGRTHRPRKNRSYTRCQSSFGESIVDADTVLPSFFCVWSSAYWRVNGLSIDPRAIILLNPVLVHDALVSTFVLCSRPTMCNCLVSNDGKWCFLV